MAEVKVVTRKTLQMENKVGNDKAFFAQRVTVAIIRLPLS